MPTPAAVSECTRVAFRRSQLGFFKEWPKGLLRPEVTDAADAECLSVDEDGVAVFVEAMLADGAAASVAEYAAGRGA